MDWLLPPGTRGLRPFSALHFQSTSDPHTHSMSKGGKGATPCHRWRSMLILSQSAQNSSPSVSGLEPRSPDWQSRAVCASCLPPYSSLSPREGHTHPQVPNTCCCCLAGEMALSSSPPLVGLCGMTSQRSFAYPSANQCPVLQQAVPLYVGQVLSLGLSSEQP